MNSKQILFIIKSLILIFFFKPTNIIKTEKASLYPPFRDVMGCYVTITDKNTSIFNDQRLPIKPGALIAGRRSIL
jgi:hypothetical protein